MSTPSPSPRTTVLDDADRLAAAVAEELARRVSSVQAEGRTPHVVLTGGTIAVAIYERLDADAADWSDVVYWFGDERYVPEGHEDRNDRQARDAFLDRCAVPAAQVRSMPAHGCSTSLAEAADGYGALLPDEQFDVVLLGVGPDGHVASLFPGFEQVHEQERRCVEVFGSPKPPPERTSLTFPALNHTRATWFLVSGDGKAEAVARAHAASGTLDETPARGAHGLEETVWWLDRDAASRL